jgi:hypothetical protein
VRPEWQSTEARRGGGGTRTQHHARERVTPSPSCVVTTKADQKGAARHAPSPYRLAPRCLSAVLTDVERRLTDRITDLITRRDTPHRVADDRALLPDRALAVLDRMTGLGFSPDYVAGQREALVLFRALAPEGLDHFLANLEHRLGDPGYADLIKRSVAAASWEPDDPRIEELATAFATNLLAGRELLAVPEGFRVGPDTATRYGLIDHHREDQSRAWARLNALVETKLRSAGIPIPYH